MSVNLEIIADDSLQLAAELQKMANVLSDGKSPGPDVLSLEDAETRDLISELEARGFTVTEDGKGEPEKPKTRKPRNKTKAKSEPASEPEPKEAPEEPEKVKGDLSDADAFSKGMDLMMKVYENDEARGAVRDLLADFDVKSFNDLSEDKGPELLKKAQELAEKFPPAEAA